MILKFIVPNIVNMISKPEVHSQKETPKVKAKVVETLIHCLKCVTGDSISPVDYRIFPDYLMPYVFDKFFESEETSPDHQDEMVNFIIIKHLGDIVNLADKFKCMTQKSIAHNFKESK